MRGHITKRGGSYYIVVDVGLDPLTGSRRQKWISGPRTRKTTERKLYGNG